MASVCNICLDKLFVATKDISALPCGHTFHRTCLDKLWAVKKHCPNCRKAWKGKIDKLYFEKYDEALKELKQTVTDLQNALKTKERIKKLMEDILRKKITEARSEQCTLKSALLDQQKEILKLHKENNALTSELEHSKIRRSSLEDGVRRSREAVKPLVNKMSSVREELNAVQEENDRLQAEVSDQRQLLKTAKNKHNEMETAYEQKLETATKEIKKLKLTIMKVEVENNALKQDLDKSKIRIEELEHQLADFWQKSQELDDLGVENAALKDKLAKVENQLSQDMIDNARQLAALRDQYKEAEDTANNELIAEVDLLKADKDALAEMTVDSKKDAHIELEKSRIRIEELEHQLAKFQEKDRVLAELEAENAALQEKLTGVETELLEIAAENARQLAALRDQYRKINNKANDELVSDVGAVETDHASFGVVSAELENSTLKQDLERSRSRIEELEHQLADFHQVNQTVSDLQSEILTLQEKLTEYENQLLQNDTDNDLQLTEGSDQNWEVVEKENDELAAEADLVEAELTVTTEELENDALKQELETSRIKIEELEYQLVDMRERNKALTFIEAENAALQEKLCVIENQLLESMSGSRLSLGELSDRYSETSDKENDEKASKTHSLENINADLAQDLVTTQEEIKTLRGQLEFCDQQMAKMVPQMIAAIETKPSSFPEHGDEIVIKVQSSTFIDNFLAKWHATIQRVWAFLNNYWTNQIIGLPHGHHF